MKTPRITYELIGELSLEFNTLQLFSTFLFNSFRNHKETGIEIIKHKGFVFLIEKIRNSSNQIIEDNESKIAIKELCNKIIMVKNKRNDLMHSIIIENNGIHERISLYESYEKKDYIRHKTNHSEIEETIRTIQDLISMTIILTANIQQKQRN